MYILNSTGVLLFIVPFGFTGELHGDSATGGLVYLRARWYNPGDGTFLTRDPFPGFATLPYSQHPYQYGYSNPVSNTDPSGESCEGELCQPADGNMAAWIAFADQYGIDRTQVMDIDNWTMADLERMVQAYARYLQNPHAYPPGSSDAYDTRADAQNFSQHMFREYLPTSGPEIESVETLLELCSAEEYIHMLSDMAMQTGWGVEQPISSAVGGGIISIIGGLKNGPGSNLGPDKGGGGGGGGSRGKPTANAAWKYHHTPYGREVPVPDSWISYPTWKNDGTIYQRPGLKGSNANSIRIMDPGVNPRYPNGYIRYYNSSGQPVKLDLKSTGTEDETHFPIDLPGPLPLPRP